MAGERTSSAHYAGDDTFCTTKHPADRQQELAGYLNGVGAAQTCPTVAPSSLFEMIGGSLFRKKLEKGCVQYREVLAEDKRLKSIEAFHTKIPGKLHHTLEDTYRLVAEHYWWEGMYFQVRDFVFGCEECHLKWTEKAERSEMGNISRLVKSHSHGVLSKLNSQREAGLFCDITLKTGSGQSFQAHRAVLAAGSEYFQELFTEMGSTTDPQPHVDLTGFREESLLALLEFSYTSTLTLNMNSLTEVATMARHLRMWPALEACSAIRREKEASQQCSDPPSPAGALSVNPGSSSVKCWRSQHSPSGRTVGLKRMMERDEGETSGSAWTSPMRCKEHTVEGPDESDGDACDGTLPSPCQMQALHPQQEDSGFSCSPTRRMKLMDFKSPSSKRKPCPRPSSVVISSSPSTSTRSSSPSRRLLRSTPGAALALRRLLPKIDLSSKSKRKSSYHQQVYRAKSDFPPAQSRAQPYPVTPLKVKQEMAEEEVCGASLQDEIHSPRAQEKYRLLTFLGLQRKSLLPSPEELSGWGQKKRLRKLKVNDYSLTARRKPRAQSLGRCGTGLGDMVGVSSSLSLCDMTRMDLLKKVMKTESQEPQDTMEKSTKRKNDQTGHMEHLSVRATRSRSLLQAGPRGLMTERPLRSNTRGPNKTVPQPAGRPRVAAQQTHAAPNRARTLRTKQEPIEHAVSQPAPSAHHCQGLTVAPQKARALKAAAPLDRPLRTNTTKSKHKLCYSVGRTTTDKCKGSRKNNLDKNKPGCNQETVRPPTKQCGAGRGDQARQIRKSTAHRNGTGGKAEAFSRSWDSSSTNYQDYHTSPLYRAIKEEPADPIPLTPTFPTSDTSDLGKRQSKPPVKLLDQGFLFGLCRPPGGIKREEESVDICLTRSVSHGSASCSDTSPGLVRRDRISARILPDRTGLDGPHWAGLGNRSTHFSQRMLLRVKKEEDEIGASHQPKAIRSSAQHNDSKRSCKVKTEPPKTKVKKLYPVSSRHVVMLESVRRARSKQLKGTCSQGSGGAHTCLQCRASYRDCDALIMHRIRHIEGKHWPCPLCSKTFFRQKNVRNHIRTHNPKLYKCRHCFAS
ncbi:uncharacterized protein LOC143511894 [Brachyhypopomus gauderio]|uniref:uncharacterized protein LOC143511894 n=1 Tax=Brachyhypopomus gauderio TaxID=698409 RepID=UPI0040412B38